MIRKKKNVLSELLLNAQQSTPEKKQERDEVQRYLEERQKRENARIREELKLREEERIRLIKEGKKTIVESLFEKGYLFSGKKIYCARADALLNFLQDKYNAIEFWQDPHVKMIYNVSDYFSFLNSIYSEETDDKKYEEWLRMNFSNPFSSKLVDNYDLVSYHQRLKNVNDIAHRFNLLKNLFRMTTIENPSLPGQISNVEIDGGAIRNVIKELVNLKFIIAISIEDTLAEPNTYKPLSKLEDDEVCFINPYNKNEVYFVNPLYVMDNNFLRLDTYNAWRNRIPKAWGEVLYKEPTMFKILDALATSRKIYVKEMYK